MNRLRHKMNFIYRALSSHIIIAILLVAALNVGSLLLYHSLQQKVIGEHEKNAEQFTRMIDRDLQQTDQIASKLFINSNIIQLQGMEDVPMLADQYQIWKIKDSLEQIVQDYDGVFYIYFRGNDILLATNSVYYRFQEVYGRSFSLSDMSYPQVKEELLAPGRRTRFVPVGEMMLAEGRTGGALYIREGPAAHFQENAVLLYVLDEKQLRSHAEATLGGHYHVSVYDGDTPLLSFGNEDTDSLTGGKHLRYTQHSAYGLTVTASLPRAVALSELSAVRIMLYMVNLLSILLAVVYIVHIGSKYSSQLSDVLASLQNQKGYLDKGLFSTLNASYVSLLKSHTEMEKTLSGQTAFLRSVVMRNLISGSLKEHDGLQALLDRADLKVAGQSHCAVLLSAQSPPAFTGEMNRYIRQCFEPLGYLYQPDEATWFVLAGFPTGREGEYKAAVASAYRQLLGAGSLSMRFSCCASELFDDFLHTSRYYTDCRLLLERISLQPAPDKVHWTDEYNPKQYDALTVSDVVENRLAELLGSGDYPGAEKCLLEIFSRNFEEHTLTPLALKLFIAQLQLLFYRCCTDAGYPRIERELLLFEQSSSRRELEEAALRIAREVCASRGLPGGDPLPTLRDEFLRYIQENFQDPGLSLKGMASHFGFSESYFSVQFKELVQENFSSYLDRTRISFADGLVCESGCKVEEIAQRSGYNSTNTFNRAYKRHFGVTASVRRRSLHKCHSHAAVETRE